MTTKFTSETARIAGALSGQARRKVKIRRNKNQDALIEIQALLISRLATHKDRLKVTTIRTIVDTLTRLSKLIEELERVNEEA